MKRFFRWLATMRLYVSILRGKIVEDPCAEFFRFPLGSFHWTGWKRTQTSLTIVGQLVFWPRKGCKLFQPNTGYVINLPNMLCAKYDYGSCFPIGNKFLYVEDFLDGKPFDLAMFKEAAGLLLEFVVKDINFDIKAPFFPFNA